MQLFEQKFLRADQEVTPNNITSITPVILEESSFGKWRVAAADAGAISSAPEVCAAEASALEVSGGGNAKVMAEAGAWLDAPQPEVVAMPLANDPAPAVEPAPVGGTDAAGHSLAMVRLLCSIYDTLLENGSPVRKRTKKKPRDQKLAG